MCLSFLSARDEFSSASIKPYCSVDRQEGGERGGRREKYIFFPSMPLCGIYICECIFRKLFESGVRLNIVKLFHLTYT